LVRGSWLFLIIYSIFFMRKLAHQPIYVGSAFANKKHCFLNTYGSNKLAVLKFVKRLTNFVKKNVQHNAIFLRNAFCQPPFNRYPLVVLCCVIYQQLSKVINKPK